MRARLALVATRLLQVIAATLAASTLIAGVCDVSTTWDVWYYHLPFAARLVGRVGPDAYAFHAANAARFAGFPLLTELLQGVLWRVTGRPESANFVAMGALALYVAFARRALAIPLHIAFVALMAIPLVQLHATACYIDLPANACLAALVVSVIRLYAAADPPPPKAAIPIVALSAIVANMRFQHHPIVAVALLAAAPRLMPSIVRALRGPRVERIGAMRTLAIGLALLALVTTSFLKNAIVHHNPYYPMRITIAGVSLPGVDDPYSSSPLYLEHVPRMVRFAFSIFEIGVRPFSDSWRWTIDQWAPYESPALRMGGFFGAYVVFHLALLVTMAVRDRPRRARVTALAFAAFTLVVSNLPQSHELRYYMAWMIVLVTLNLWLACDRVDGAVRGPALGVACVPFLAVVLIVTRCGYVYPFGSSFPELVRAKVDARVIEGLHDGDRICLRREPWTFLYAPPFHAPARYAVKEAETPDECGSYRWVP